MTKRVAVMLGKGFEPIEACAPIDFMRRAGLEVVTISVQSGREVEAAQGVWFIADQCLDDEPLTAFDAIVLPGGMGGVEALLACKPLLDILPEFMAHKTVAAICAGPLILANLGLLDGRKATCYPGCEEGFDAWDRPEGNGVITDGNLITASGPGFALPFGYEITAVLLSTEVAEKVARDMLMK